MRLLLLILALLVSGAAVPAVAGPFEDAVAAYNKGEYATVLRLVRPLADQGDARAQAMLGMFYFLGRGVPQDYAAAMSWLRKAAEQGNADAQAILGIAYTNGEGVPQDYAAALSWSRKAAEQGSADAQANLGYIYANGQGVPRDNVQAHRWLNIAASRFAASDKEAREMAVKTRDAIAAKMTPAQITEAQKLAREWKPKQ